MQFTPKEIKSCLDLVATIREVYFTYYHGEKAFVSVNSLLEIAKNNYKKIIDCSFHDENYADHHVYSFIITNEDGDYSVCLLSGMTNCWQRFALCKELFHLILDEDSTRNPSIAVHLEDFTSSIIGVENGGRASSKNEVLAEFAAMQFLFPYAVRQKCIEDLAQSSAPIREDFQGIAEKFRLPRLMVEEYLGNRMMDLFDAISWVEKSDDR
jgi:hypothetical protein